MFPCTGFGGTACPTSHIAGTKSNLNKHRKACAQSRTRGGARACAGRKRKKAGNRDNDKDIGPLPTELRSMFPCTGFGGTACPTSHIAGTKSNLDKHRKACAHPRPRGGKRAGCGRKRKKAGNRDNDKDIGPSMAQVRKQQTTPVKPTTDKDGNCFCASSVQLFHEDV